jgi:hypothetical protein
MGFNRRKMEDQRREAAEKEAAARRATDAQVLEDAERLIAAWNERQGTTRADDLFAQDRRRHQGRLLVLVGALSCLPNHQCNRLAHTRSSSRRCGDKPHSLPLVPLMLTERAVRGACLSRTSIADEMRKNIVVVCWVSNRLIRAAVSLASPITGCVVI